MDRNFCSAFIFVTSIKLLFVPMYHSTDIEVHRNWKAITHNLNYKQWYFEDTSPWTLDYPPFFAWFEYALSHGAKFFDHNLLDIKNLNYDSVEAKFFMRITVIFSDLLYAFAIGKIYHILKQKKEAGSDPWIRPEVIFAMLMLWNPGLLIVDHIHFQYNGFLNGLLFLSVAAIMQDKYLTAALWYSVLLNCKHLYMCFAPVYFVYLLKNYCFNQQRFKGTVILESFSMKKFLRLGAVVSGVFALSFGPFIASGQFMQVLKQMFPVKRGLTHAYWAPNFWALYNFLDRVLVTLTQLISGHKRYGTNSATKGLVQQYHHVILPSVNVGLTVFLTSLSVIPFMWIIWKKPKNWSLFIQAIIGCAFGTFMFGYHVHEKAILMVILPLTILAVCHRDYASIFVLISTIGHFSLFPLLFSAGETPVKIVLLILHATYSYTSLKRLHQYSPAAEGNRNIFSTMEILFLSGLPMIQFLNSFGLSLLKLEAKLPFLPLLVTSVYCAMGVFYCWVKYCQLVFEQI